MLKLLTVSLGNFQFKQFYRFIKEKSIVGKYTLFLTSTEEKLANMENKLHIFFFCFSSYLLILSNFFKWHKFVVSCAFNICDISMYVPLLFLTLILCANIFSWSVSSEACHFCLFKKPSISFILFIISFILFVLLFCY